MPAKLKNYDRMGHKKLHRLIKIHKRSNSHLFHIKELASNYLDEMNSGAKGNSSTNGFSDAILAQPMEKALNELLHGYDYSIVARDICPEIRKILAQDFLRLDAVNWGGRQMLGIWHGSGAFLEVTCDLLHMKIDEKTATSGLVVLSGKVDLGGSDLSECRLNDVKMRSSSVEKSEIDGKEVYSSRVGASTLNSGTPGKVIWGKHIFFGKIISSIELWEIENLKTSPAEKPAVHWKIWNI